MNSVNRRNVALLRLIHIADSAIFLWPVVILYYYKVAGSAAGAGVLLSVMSIASVLGEVPLGMYSDRYGRARTAQIASLLGLMSMGLIVAAWWLGFWVLVAAVVLQGFGDAAESGNHDSLLYESSANKEIYQRTSSWLGTLGFIAGAVSAMIGGIVGSRSLLIVAVVSLVPRAVSLLATFGLQDKASHHDLDRAKSSFRELFAVLFKDRALRLVISGKVIADGIGEVSWQYRALFVKTVWPVWALGLSLPISLVANAGGSVLYTKFQKKINSYRPTSVLLSTTITGRLMLLLGFVMQNTLSPVLIGVAGAAGPTNRATYSALLHSHLPNESRASGFSVVSLLRTLLFSAASVLAGVLIDSKGIQFTMIMVTLVALSGNIFYYGASKADSKSTEAVAK